MKQTRFSKLQRWLLRTCYQNMVKMGHDPKNAFCYKIDIYRDYYKLPCHTGKSGHQVKAFFDSPPGSAPPALSRSLRNLFEKGFVLDPKFFYAVVLTDAGIIKAKELLAQ